jgi:hypothetical protein
MCQQLVISSPNTIDNVEHLNHIVVLNNNMPVYSHIQISLYTITIEIGTTAEHSLCEMPLDSMAEIYTIKFSISS